MIRFLLEEAQTGMPGWVLPVILVVLLIFMVVYNTKKSNKAREDAENFMRELKVGDKVRTYHGVYGTIVSITETTDGPIAVLETGDETHKSYMTVALAAVGGIDSKKDVIYDAEGNPIIPEEEQEVTEEAKTEEVVESVEEKLEEVKEPEVKEETVVEEVKEVEVPTEEKPKKKTTTKKTSTTAKKKTTKKSDE